MAGPDKPHPGDERRRRRGAGVTALPQAMRRRGKNKPQPAPVRLGGGLVVPGVTCSW